jgi:UDP-GlcNAc:undecaprenyl-phosphate GlcNAc-1-phosphate transferase
LVLAVVAFAGTLAATLPVRRLAAAVGAVDQPGGRRVNKEPVPRLGGLALFFGLLLALALELIGEGLWGWQGMFSISSISTETAGGSEHAVSYVGVLLGLLVMLAVGVVDDIHHLHAGLKLLGQIIAAAIIVAAGVAFTELQLPFSTVVLPFGPAGYLLSVLYLVCFANIINLIDGLDGLATTVASIAAAALLIMAVITQQPATLLLAALVLGSCLGFLPANLSPAKLFLGDSGALFLGLVLGTLSLFVVMRAPSFKLLAAVLIVATVPILDTLAAIVRRLRAHRRIYEADAEHLHHRMLARFRSSTKVVAVVAVWMLGLAVCGILMFIAPGPIALLLLIVAAITSIALFARLGGV